MLEHHSKFQQVLRVTALIFYQKLSTRGQLLKHCRTRISLNMIVVWLEIIKDRKFFLFIIQPHIPFINYWQQYLLYMYAFELSVVSVGFVVCPS